MVAGDLKPGDRFRLLEDHMGLDAGMELEIVGKQFFAPEWIDATDQKEDYVIYTDALVEMVDTTEEA